MAIKVNGTTVIDDSRNLSNVGGLKTVNGNSLVGSGNISAGASTSTNAVGTYALLTANGIYNDYGDTEAGSNLNLAASCSQHVNDPVTLSGTWRCMGFHDGLYAGSLYVRIS